MSYSRYDRVDGILPTGKSLNPARPEGADYYDPNLVAYVMFKLNDERTRPTRVITSHGVATWNLGEKYSLYHDQTGAFLGDYEVVGIADFALGYAVGDIPDRMLKHSVFK